MGSGTLRSFSCFPQKLVSHGSKSELVSQTQDSEARMEWLGLARRGLWKGSLRFKCLAVAYGGCECFKFSLPNRCPHWKQLQSFGPAGVSPCATMNYWVMQCKHGQFSKTISSQSRRNDLFLRTFAGSYRAAGSSLLLL